MTGVSCLFDAFPNTSAPLSSVLKLKYLTTSSVSMVELMPGQSLSKSLELRGKVTRHSLCHLASKCGDKIGYRVMQQIWKQFHIKEGLVWLQFGSVYDLVDGLPRNFKFKYSNDIELLVNHVKHELLDPAVGDYWCAHVLTGYGDWDQQGARDAAKEMFSDVFHTELKPELEEWLTIRSKSRGFLMSDSLPNVVSTTCVDSNCILEDRVFELIPGTSRVQKLAVIQLLCAGAKDVFLTPHSTFSRTIGMTRHSSGYV